MQKVISHTGLGTFIDLNFDRFLMPAAILIGLFVGAFIGSL